MNQKGCPLSARFRDASCVGCFRHRRLLVQIGKGGVGKTSLSAGLALAAARTGRRVLLVEVRAPRCLPPMFDIEIENDEPRRLTDNIRWINLTPHRALEIYAIRLLRFRSVYRAVFEQRMVRRFLEAVPALNEILMLGHLRDLLDDPELDLVVLDAPSSGPGALMLEAPSAVIETAPPGPLRDGAVWIREKLSDPAHTAVNLVVLPEELPVTEAIELKHRLRDRLGLPMGVGLVNRVLNDPFGDRPQALLAPFADCPQAAGLLRSAGLLQRRLQLQKRYFDRIRAGLDLPLLTVCEEIETAFGSGLTNKLANSLDCLFGDDA